MGELIVVNQQIWKLEYNWINVIQGDYISSQLVKKLELLISYTLSAA